MTCNCAERLRSFDWSRVMPRFLLVRRSARWSARWSALGTATGSVLVSVLLPALLASWLTGCASPLPVVDRTPSVALVAPPASPLSSVAADAAIAPGRSGVWPLLQAEFALDARLAAIRAATTSIDLQYYLIADDSIGRPILRALRDAALRGVRVRLLVDDLYTADMDRLLLGLAATPNAEVRLFNPVVTARGSTGRRVLATLRDFKRLNHRMHNKLFIADGAVAVVGGRNLADEYFLRGVQGNFIDFDLLCIGAVVSDLSHWFDLYWNSTAVYPARAIAQAASAEPLQAEAAFRAAFEDATRADAVPGMPTPPATAPDAFGAPRFSTALTERRFRFISAEAAAFADSPDKIDPAHHSSAVRDTLSHRFLGLLDEAHDEVYMFSPYFIPGADALARLRALRAAGVSVRVVTNSLAVSDEPLVAVGLARHQRELLRMGVDLYELSSTRLKLDSAMRNLLGSSIGRLHAKLAFIDRKTVLVGSMNLDPRSANLNTEIGVRVRSPELAAMIFGGFKVAELAGVYRVQLKADGSSVRWTTADGGPSEELEVDPDTSQWQRLRVMLLSLFVPDSQL